MSAEMNGDLQEKKTHGTENFPCSLYKSKGEKQILYVKHHWHREIEMVYFISGGFRLEVNMEKYHIKEECFCFINSGELHYIKSELPFEEQAVVFHPKMLQFEAFDDGQKKVIQPIFDNSLMLPRFVNSQEPGFEPIKQEFLQIREVLREHGQGSESLGEYEGEKETADDTADQLIIKASLLKILAYLKKYNLISEVREKEDYRIEVVKRVLTYIHENYTEKIYIRDLAREVNMNEQYFCRFFKKAIGKTPMEYVNDYRIKNAMKLLRSSDMQVMEICMECGFNNLGNFMKEFRKITGTTPLKYRKMTNEVKIM